MALCEGVRVEEGPEEEESGSTGRPATGMLQGSRKQRMSAGTGSKTGQKLWANSNVSLG